MSSIRWTPDQLADYEKKRIGKKTKWADAVKPQIMLPKESKLERRFDQQLLESGLPEPRRNWFFIAGRDFELDRAWPSEKVAVEVQGMAHRIKGKFKRDIEKRALAMLAGWRVLEVDGSSIRDGRAIEWTQKLLGQ
jgi:very-short-patch-repair endonuclease